MNSSDFTFSAWPSPYAVILFLGNDAALARQIRQDLAETGSKLIVCRTEKGARKILESYPVNILLLQSQSEGYHDITPFLNLRHDFPEQTFFVLLLTPSMDRGQLTAAFKAGIDDFITIPYDCLIFLASIRIGIQSATLHRELKKKNENLSVAVTSYEGAFKQVGTLAQELQKKNRQLEQLNNLKDEMVDIVAHDLRNPISAVEMYTDYLIEELPNLAEEPKSFLLNTKTLITEVLTMLSELLDISNFETGKMKVHPDAVEIRSFLEPIIERMNLLFSQKKICYHLDLDKAPETWVFDKKRIAQVLENLLTNAAKFSMPGNSVTVRVNKQDDCLQISVEDKGQGILKDEISKIFQKFHKGSAKPTAGESSTGLGLAIAKQIIKQHQGKIVVNSILGKGATFTIILPYGFKDSSKKEEIQQVVHATP